MLGHLELEPAKVARHSEAALSVKLAHLHPRREPTVGHRSDTAVERTGGGRGGGWMLPPKSGTGGAAAGSDACALEAARACER